MRYYACKRNRYMTEENANLALDAHSEAVTGSPYNGWVVCCSAHPQLCWHIITSDDYVPDDAMLVDDTPRQYASVKTYGDSDKDPSWDEDIPDIHAKIMYNMLEFHDGKLSLLDMLKIGHFDGPDHAEETLDFLTTSKIIERVR